MCDEVKARALVERFLAAYNRGEHGLADRFFAEEGRFQWYSEDPGRVTNGSTGPYSNPYDRSTLDAYLAERHAQGDRLATVALSDFRFRPSDRTASFAISVTRPKGAAKGKATLDCRTQRLIVWSLGRPSSS